MENEGIMALPQGAAMQEDQGQMPMVTSADAYDAAQTAMGMVNPQELAVLKESLRQNMAELELTPAQLETLIEIFEYVSQNPGQYKTIREDLINRDFVDAEDLPEEYDPEFLGAILIVLNELKMTAAQGASAAMMEGPPVEGMGMQPMAMAEGGLADMAALLAAQGRNGDKMLAHITPEEAEFLKSRGGAGTINPVTGLPEFFLKKLFNAVKSVVKSVVNVVKKVVQSPVGRILGTIALATVLGPTAIGATLGTAGTAALASGATTLIAGGSIKDALVAGAMGYVGGGGTIMGVSPVAAVGQYLPGYAGSALNTGLATGAIGTGVGLIAGMKPAQALQMGAMSGLSAAALQGLSNSKALADARFARDMGQELTVAQQQALTLAGEPLNTGPLSGTGTEGGPLRLAPGGVGTVGQGGVGQVGTTGTAQDLLGQGLRPGSGGQGLQVPLNMRPEFSTTNADFSTGVGGTAPTTNYDLLARGYTAPTGLQPSPMGFASDFSRAAGGTAASTNYSLTPAQATQAATQPAGFIDRMVSGAKDLYNEYLSPSRPGLPADAGILQKYGPLALAGTAAIAATGGMEGEPANQNPAFNRNYTGMDYIRDNPGMFQGGLDNSYQRPDLPRGTLVDPSQMYRYSSIPLGQPGVVQPTGVTRSPAGVAQPYNVAGLYGVPLIYGQQPPPGYAKGGELRPTEFPRKNGPINGPGTGTSDSIPAMLSDGEFVFTAKAVRNAGGGSRRKGAARMYKLMKKLEGGPVKAK
jgi:hypothetical protein